MEDSVSNMDPSISPSLWTLCIAGSFTWPGLWFFFWTFLAGRYPGYLACGTAMRLVNCVHAIVHVIGAVVIMSETYTDTFYADSTLLDQLNAFTAAYWIYDIAIMYIAFCKENKLERTPFLATLRPFLGYNPLIVVHHIAIVIGGLPLVLIYRRGKGAFMISIAHFAEMSAPFLNLRKIFVRHGYTDNFVFRGNSLLAVTTFILTRIILFPSLYLIHAYVYQQTLRQVVTSMHFKCHFFMISIIILQTTWFIFFVRALMKERPSKKEIGNGRERNGSRMSEENGFKNGGSHDVRRQKSD